MPTARAPSLLSFFAAKTARACPRRTAAKPRVVTAKDTQWQRKPTRRREAEAHAQ
jgi:hypothetical protein